jgi:molecular chaperone GrpE (heat shock protein)
LGIDEPCQFEMRKLEKEGIEMKRIQTEVVEILGIWEKQYGRLTPTQRKAFRLNALTRKIAFHNRRAIEKSIKFAGKKYLKDILNYLQQEERANSSYERPKLVSSDFLKDVGTSKPVSSAGPCGHRYRCTCSDAFSVLRLVGRAA